MYECKKTLHYNISVIRLQNHLLYILVISFTSDSVCFYMYLCTCFDNPLCIDLTYFLLSCGVNDYLGSDYLARYSPADDMSTSSAREGYLASGVNSILPKEHAGSFVNLPISKAEMDNGFVCSTILYTVLSEPKHSSYIKMSWCFIIFPNNYCDLFIRF